MRKIEVRTTQNVVVEYDLAGTGDRMLAFGLDFGMVMLVAGGSYLIAPNASPLLELIRAIFVTMLTSCYHLLMEAFITGRSLGKQIMGLDILKVDGGEVSVYDSLLRWTSRIVDIGLSFGLLAILGVSTSKERQRVGDRLANTVVVKSSRNSRVSLENLQSMTEASDYVAKYPEVKYMDEQDMLLVQEVLNRRKEHKNASTDMAVNELAEKLAEMIRVNLPSGSREDFLRRALKDYIYLTR